MTDLPTGVPGFPDPPKLTPSSATTPPLLPETWRAIGLLTPWEDAQLQVALVDGNSANGTMRVRLIGLEYGYVDLLFDKTGAYLLYTEALGSDVPDRIYGPIMTTSKVPTTTWLVDAEPACAGIGDLLGRSSAWWVGTTTCQNGYVNGPTPPTPALVGNLFNVDAETGLPWRFVFVNPTNDYLLPVLGAYPIVHFPMFEADSADSQCQQELTRLSELATAQTTLRTDGKISVDSAAGLEQLLLGSVSRMSEADRRQCREIIERFVPGLSPGLAAGTLPYWEERLFLTSFSSPTGQMPGAAPPRPIPTQVFYDWPERRMLTRMWVGPDTYEDAILDPSTTHVVRRYPNGTHDCVKTLPVGLVQPRWASLDTGARCRAVITNNPQLSPGTTINVCVLPSRPGQVFWTWYTAANRPVMFIEVPQACDVMLLLTDYADADPSPPPFPPSLFVVPPDCLTPTAMDTTGATGCASCP